MRSLPCHFPDCREMGASPARLSATRRPAVPAPAGAIILLLPIYVQDLGLHVPSLTPLVLFYTLGIALLMVSRVPTFNRKARVAAAEHKRQISLEQCGDTVAPKPSRPTR